jgi:hypothetical protein
MTALRPVDRRGSERPGRQTERLVGIGARVVLRLRGLEQLDHARLLVLGRANHPGGSLR